MSRIKKQKNYSFVLSGIDLEKIYKQYKLELDSGNNQLTMIDDLIMDKTQKAISFVDENKNTCKCVVHIPNLNSTGKLACYWCRNLVPKGIKPLGCPVKYITNQLVKTYFSEINKDHYKIKENISDKKFKEFKESLQSGKDPAIKDNYALFENGYYILDGIFCSFNCCVAFIEDNSNLSIYKNSYTLLLKFYGDLFGEEIKEIESAPHWKKLIEYGGDLTIEQFRNNFYKIDYVQHGTNISIPKGLSIGYLFEEKIKF